MVMVLSLASCRRTTPEESNRLVKRHTSLSGDEVKGDEVDRLGRLDVNVTYKLVAIDDLRWVVCGVTNYQEIIHATLSLNVSHKGIDIVLEE